MKSPVFLCSSCMYLAVPELREEHPPARVYEATRVVARDRRVVVAAHRPVDGAGRRTAQRIIGCDFAIVAIARCGYSLADALDNRLEEIREGVRDVLEEGELRQEVAGVRQRRADRCRWGHGCCCVFWEMF